MGIDVNEARIRAGQMTQYKVWLETSKRKMLDYKNQINSNWNGVEVPHMITAIDQVITSLNQAIRELDSISRDVVTVADTIRAEEIEAERRENERIARANVERLSLTLKNLKNQKKVLEESLQSQSNPAQEQELNEVVKNINKTTKDYNNWRNRLNSLRR